MATSVSLEPQEPVAALAEKPPKPRRAPPPRWTVWLVCVLALALVLGLVVVAARRARRAPPAAAGASVPYVAATRGMLVRSVRVSGVLGAVRFASVSAPSLRGQTGTGGPQLTLVRFATAGTRVQQGDVLAEFERQAQLNTFEERRAEFLSLTDQIAKRRAELDIEREKQQTDLQKAHADREAARLENQRNEVISAIDAEKNQLALTEAGATLKMLEQTLKLREAAAAAELKLLEIRRGRERLQMEHARTNYEQLILRSPISGMVVLTPIWKNRGMGIVQEGEQVRPGMVFLQVVDPSSMVVRARLNQLDAALLRPGGPVEVHLDAYPGLSFPGRVENASTLALSSDWSQYLKIFPVVFSVQGSDPRMIPDISASVDVELEQVPEAVLVPRGAVLRQAGAGSAGTVWVKQGEQLQARNVTLGSRNDTQWAILAGLQEGEMVSVFPPSRSGGAIVAGTDAGPGPGPEEKSIAKAAPR